MNKDCNCIFCKIVDGVIPSYKVYEDDVVYAFLDVNPSNKGHTLVVPKNHSMNMLETDDEILSHAYKVAKRIGLAAKKELGACGANILTNVGEKAGQSVLHFHIHVIPRYADDTLTIGFPTKQLDAEQAKVLLDAYKKSI